MCSPTKRGRCGSACTSAAAASASAGRTGFSLWLGGRGGGDGGGGGAPVGGYPPRPGWVVFFDDSRRGSRDAAHPGRGEAQPPHRQGSKSREDQPRDDARMGEAEGRRAARRRHRRE